MSIYKGKQKEIKRLRNKVMLFWSYSYNIFQNNACKNALFFSFKKTSNCSILSIELTFKWYMSHQKIRSTSTMQKRWALRLYANLWKNMYILLKYVYMYILLLNLSSHLNSTCFDTIEFYQFTCVIQLTLHLIALHKRRSFPLRISW